MIPPDLERFHTRYRQGVDAFVAGDADQQKRLWSRADDATLANPLWPVARGWDEIARTIDRAAAAFGGGEPGVTELVSFDATADMAYTLEFEHATLRIGDAAAPSEVALRVTTVFRRESDGWKVVHRHADPITSPRPPQSLVRQ